MNPNADDVHHHRVARSIEYGFVECILCRTSRDSIEVFDENEQLVFASVRQLAR